MDDSSNNSSMNIKSVLIIGGVTIFIIFFVLITAIFYEEGMFDDFSDNSGIVDSYEQITISSSTRYWWPIGGSEIKVINGVKYAPGTPTSVSINSKFSKSRTLGGVTKAHRGIDIGHSGVATNYIIAAKDGTVYKVFYDCDNSGGLSNNCNYGSGNQVVLKHSDGNYTLYKHLSPASERLVVGETVKQGQVIGIMGNSGRSSGRHLHFQIDAGDYSNDKATDPLNYVSKDNPRPGGVSNSLSIMLQLLEGTGPTEGDYYIAYHGAADANDIITIGHGVVIKYNVARFKARGFADPVNEIKEGTKVLKSIVDDIEKEIVNEKRTAIANKLNNRNILLQEYQIDALVCRIYNVGNIDNFYSNYEKYGVSQALYDNYMYQPVRANGKYVAGLKTRREIEWKLFKEGLYYGVNYK